MPINDLLVGEKVCLAPLSREHLPPMIDWFSNDMELIRFGINIIAYPSNQSDKEAWFERKQQQALDMKTYSFTILSLANHEVVGDCGLAGFNWQARVAEVGINIGTGFRSLGYGTDAVRLLLRYGFMELNLNRIQLRVFAHNYRAIRAYEKVGFVEEGRLREVTIRDGQTFDTVMMSVLRSEWVEQQNANS